METEQMINRRKPFNATTLVSITIGILSIVFMIYFTNTDYYQYLTENRLSTLYLVKSLWGLGAFFIFYGLHRLIDKKWTAIVILFSLGWIIFFLLVKEAGHLIFG